MFYTGRTCTLQPRGKSPTTSRHTAIHSFKLCRAPWLSRRCVCHWDPTQVIRILFKYVFTEPTNTSHSYSLAQEITDHLPYSAFLATHLTLIHILFCSLWDVFCLCLYLKAEQLPRWKFYGSEVTGNISLEKWRQMKQLLTKK